MSPRSSSCPYVGLQPYDEEDWEYFFGRERDQRIISANLYSNSLTILYGASGVGKSSVLNAGVVPKLRQKPGTAVVVFRNWHSPEFLSMLKEECIKAVELVHKKASTITPSLPLDELLFNLGQLFGGTILILFDQFEEYFVYQPESETEYSFESELACAVNRPEVDANFLISLREDGLAKLDRFSGRIPNLMENTLRLQHLNAEAAEEAIRKPLDVYNRYVSQASEKVSIEDTLVHKILSQVRSPGELTRVEHAKGHDRIAQIVTPFLQLVLERLWKAEMNDSSHVLRLSTFERLKGAQQIVRTHLDEVMDRLSPTEQASWARIFNNLVTPSGAKKAQLLTDLAKWANLEEDQLAPTLKMLSDNRILRRIAPSPDQPKALQYEVFHDVMAEAVLEWQRGYAEAAKVEQVRKEVEEQGEKRRRSLIIYFALILVLVLAGVFVWKASKDAQRAFSDKLVTEASSKLDKQLDLALLLSLEANRAFDTKKAKDILVRGLQQHPHLSAFLGRHKKDIISVAFSPSGKTLASGSADGAIILWDVDNRKSLTGFSAGENVSVSSVALSPDGKTLATTVVTASGDNTIKLWDTATRQELATLPGLAAWVSSLAFSADGKTLASGSADGTVILWNVSDKKCQTNIPIGDKISSLAFSPVDSTLAVASGDKVISLWDAATGQKLATLPGLAAWVSFLAFSSDGKTLASGSADGTVILWNVSVKQRQAEFSIGDKVSVSSVAFSPVESTLAVASGDKPIRLWDAATGQERTTLTGLAAGVSSLAFSPDGKTLASGSADGTVILWNVSDSKAAGRLLITQRDSVSSVALSPDGKTLATILVNASWDKIIQLWDTATGQELALLSDLPAWVSSVAFSPDGKTLASGSADGTVILWKVIGRISQRKFSAGDKVSVPSVALSPDGKTLATTVVTASGDNTIKLWDTETGQELATLPGLAAGVSSVAFSPDGKTLASGSADGTVILWNVSAKQRQAEFSIGDKVPVSSVAFSPDAKTLAWGNADGTVIFWDLAGQMQINKLLTSQTDPVSSIAFTPDGKNLVSAGGDGAVTLWDLSTVTLLGFSSYESLESRACRRANRNLTREEWGLYMGDKPYRETCPDLPSGEGLTNTSKSVRP